MCASTKCTQNSILCILFPQTPPAFRHMCIVYELDMGEFASTHIRSRLYIHFICYCTYAKLALTVGNLILGLQHGKKVTKPPYYQQLTLMWSLGLEGCLFWSTVMPNTAFIY